jgi:hypothetical protein
MNSFYKVIGIVRIVFVELLILILFVGFVSNLAKDLDEGTVNADLVYLITTGVLGTLLLVWLVWTIVWPHMTTETAPANFLLNVTFDKFISTHPSYIFVDVIFLLWAYALDEFASNSVFENTRTQTILILGITIPFLRLFFWYVMKFRYPKEKCRGAWKPIMWFYIIVAPIAILYVIGTVMNA